MANPLDNAVNPPANAPSASWGSTAAAVGAGALGLAGVSFLGPGTVLGVLGAGVIGATIGALGLDENQRSIASARNLVAGANDIMHDGLGPKVESVIRQGVAKANQPAHPTLRTGLTLARHLQQALDSEVPEEIATRQPISQQLRNTIQQILDLPQPAEGDARRLSDAGRATLTNLRDLLDAPENIQELRNLLPEGIQTLLEQQGLTDQINHVAQSVLEPLVKTVKEVKELVTGRPRHIVLAHARDALFELQEKITYSAVKRSDLTRDAEALTTRINSPEFINTMGDAGLEEFIKLEQVLGRLGNEETADADLPRKEEVIPFLRRAYEILDQHTHEQSGITTRAANDTSQLVHNVLNEPMKAWNLHRGKNPETGPIIIAPENDNGPTTLMDYLWAMSSHLSTYLQSDEGQKTISKQVIINMGSALLLTLQGALDSIEGRPNFDPTYANIEALKERVENLINRANLPVLEAENPATISELYNIVGDSINQLSSVPIYINSLFKVPGSGRSSVSINSLDTPFLSNLSKLKETAGIQEEDASFWEAKAKKEKNKFINNTKNFLILKIVYEKICGLKANDQFYLDIICEINQHNENEMEQQPDNDPLLRESNEAHLRDTNDALLREALFNRLAGANFANVNFGSIRKRLARAAYRIVSYFLNQFMQKLGTDYLDEAFDYIKENKLLGVGQRVNLNAGNEEVNANNTDEEAVLFNSLKSTLVENFTGYLMALNGTYRRVANNPLPKGSLSKMRQQELARPEVNDNASPEELYGSFAKLVIGKCMNNDFLAWLFRHIIGGQEAVVEGIIDKSVGSLMDANGYTHALNTVFVALLKDILTIMKDNEEAGTQAPTTTYQDADSRQNKAKMTVLVRNLFEILEKNKCETQDDLIAFFKDPSLSQKLVKMGDDLFMEDVIESVADVLTLAIRELVTEKKMNQLIHQFTGLINNVYKTGHNYTRQEVKETETELVHLTNQLLTVSISSAVKKKFDFMGGQEQTETNKHIDLVRQQTEDLTDTISPCLDTFVHTIQNPNPNVPLRETDELQAIRLKTIADTTYAYLDNCKTDRFNSQGSQLNSDNIDRLDRIYRTADNNTTHFVTNISEMRKAQQEICNKNTLDSRIVDMRRIANEIPARFPEANHAPEDIERSDQEVHELEGILRTVEQFIPNQSLSALKDSFTTLAESLQGLRERVSIIAFYVGLFANDGLLNQIMRGRRGHVLCPTAVKAQIEELRHQIPIGLDAAVRIQLMTQLDKIRDSMASPQIDAARAAFIEIARQAEVAAGGEHLNAQKELIRGNCREIHAKLNQLNIDPNYIAARRRIIRESFPEAQRGLTQIRRSYLHSGLVDAEKNASALTNEIDQKVAELRALPEGLQGNRLAQMRRELAPKIAELAAPLNILAIQGPVVFHHNGEVREQANLDVADRDAMNEKLLLFGAAWIDGLPDDITLEAARGQVQELLELIKKLKGAQSEHNAFAPISYYNINASDMHSAKDLITGLVFKRVRERADGLIDLVSSEEFYRYGLIHHMFLIPYLKRNNAMPKPKKNGPLGLW